MLRRLRKGRGFTLIEVTLSIVIGIILIAGATLLYNQAKTGAGNTRAKAKVYSLQGAVEETAANAGGAYPSVATIQNLWPQKRPDDYLASPWGGSLTAGNGVMTNSGLNVGGVTIPGPGGTAFSTAMGGGTTNAASAAYVVYDDFNGVNLATAGGSYYDQMTGATTSAVVKNYAVYIVLPNGAEPAFVAGGK